MTLKQCIIEHVDHLSVDKQREVLRFVESLATNGGHRKPWPGLKGALARPGLSITEQDIDEARREMWSCFPRDIE